MARWFRKSGYRKALEAVSDDESSYGGRPEWDASIHQSRDTLDLLLRANGFSTAEVMAQSPWPTMGRYLGDK